jgi:hypothetical protein
MSFLFYSIALVVACEACDELAKSGVAHPFAIDASWRPKCDADAARFVASDPWPRVGEVRRDSFTRDCADISMTRVFLAAPGLTADELFVGARVEKKLGRGASSIETQEFIGQASGYSYRYHFTADGQRVVGSVEGPQITSHLVSTALKSPPRGSLQTVSCEIWRGQCEVLMKRAGDDVPSSPVTIAFDAARPAGDVCLDVPPAEGSPVSVSLQRGQVRIVDRARAPAGTARACLGDTAPAALTSMSEADAVTYRVDRPGPEGTPWDVVTLDARGLGPAAELARFLLREAVLRKDRSSAAQKLKAEADILLDGAAIPN